MTTPLKDRLRQQTRLARMRHGAEVPDFITLPSNPEERIAIVPLTEAESQSGVSYAASIDVPDNIVGITLRNRAAVQSDVWNGLRELDDPTRKVFSSIEEMVEILDPVDIDYAADQLTILMEYASPSLDKLTPEDLDDLKKAFVLIDWKELSGRRWSALKLCLSSLLPELLQDRSFSTTSIANLTTTNESDESI